MSAYGSSHDGIENNKKALLIGVVLNTNTDPSLWAVGVPQDDNTG